MSDCRKCRTLFTGALYKELSSEQKDFFENHLQTCPKCRSEFAKLASTVKIMDKRFRPEPGQDFWNGYWERLVKRMEEEGLTATESESSWQRLSRAFRLTPKWVYQLSAAALLIILGIFIGRLVFIKTPSEAQQASLKPRMDFGTELTQRTQNYIERSKLILLAVVNFDPETEDPYALNLAHQQRISRELIQEAGFLKEKLADSKQRRLQSLIADLELILLQIANLGSENDFEAIRLVKDGVENRGILMEIDLTAIRRAMKKENKEMPMKKASSRFQSL